ncbi:MAG: hypothetical protein KBI12_04760 [Methanothrix sp.]|nr:hypothetical protein [Methanothrix sp.]
MSFGDMLYRTGTAHSRRPRMRAGVGGRRHEAEVYRQWSEMSVIYFVSRPWNDPATVPESINGMRGDPRCGRAVGLALTPSAAQWYSRYPPRSPQSRKAIFRKLNSHHRGHRELTETDNNYIDRSKTMPRFFSVRSVSSW